jgi:CheY-like chemotaxis protein
MSISTTPSGTETILAVEDDPGILDLLITQLKGLGYAVMAVKDAKTALALLRNAPKIDLLFTDIVLVGGMNGRDLAERAQRLHPGLKVLFTSGNSTASVIHRSPLGPNPQLLLKPFRREELAVKVRSILDER